MGWVAGTTYYSLHDSKELGTVPHNPRVFFVILQAQTLEVKTAWVTEITRLLWKQAMRSKGTCFLTKPPLRKF